MYDACSRYEHEYNEENEINGDANSRYRECGRHEDAEHGIAGTGHSEYDHSNRHSSTHGSAAYSF